MSWRFNFSPLENDRYLTVTGLETWTNSCRVSQATRRSMSPWCKSSPMPKRGWWSNSAANKLNSMDFSVNLVSCKCRHKGGFFWGCALEWENAVSGGKIMSPTWNLLMSFYFVTCINFIFIHQVASARRQRRDLSVFESSCHLSTTHGGGFALCF